MSAGETSLKGHLLLRLLAAQIDATKRRISRADMPALLVGAAENATSVCLPILESIAAQQPGSGGTEMTEAFDFSVSPEFMEDWDLVMSDGFSFGGDVLSDSFLT